MEIETSQAGSPFPLSETPEVKLLPFEIVLYILEFVGLQDVVAFSAVNKACHASSKDNHYWKLIVLKSSSTPANLNPTSLAPPTTWKEIFDSHQLAISNLKEGKYTQPGKEMVGVSWMATYGGEGGGSKSCGNATEWW